MTQHTPGPEPNITFVIGDLACVALSLDGPAPKIDDRVISVEHSSGRRLNRVTCSLADARYLQDLAASMGAPSGAEGWAIGVGERRACRRAAEQIRRAILRAVEGGRNE